MGIIRLKDVNKYYLKNSLKVLNELSLTVVEGEMIVIMGTSGSGKSTLLNLVGGLDVPTNGSVEIMGRKLLSTPKLDDEVEFKRKNIGFIFQDFNLLESLTVNENIDIILSIKDSIQTSDQIDSLLSTLGINKLRKKPVFQLSGGEKQRLAIALALFSNTKIILADEPTGNLDSKHTTDLMNNLKELQKKYRKTILLVTHDPIVASYGDRVVFLKDGKVSGELTIDESKDKHEAMFDVLKYFYSVYEEVIR